MWQFHPWNITWDYRVFLTTAVLFTCLRTPPKSELDSWNKKPICPGVRAVLYSSYNLSTLPSFSIWVLCDMREAEIGKVVRLLFCRSPQGEEPWHQFWDFLCCMQLSVLFWRGWSWLVLKVKQEPARMIGKTVQSLFHQSPQGEEPLRPPCDFLLCWEISV